MISRTHRFHGYNSLRHVYGRGQTVRGPLLTIRYIENQRRSSQGYRAAVVVSRKVHKSAVVRARIRRRLYEIIRGAEANIQGPYDIVLIVQSEQIASMEASELQEQVLGQLRRAGIISGGTSRPTDGIVDTKERKV